MIVKDRKPDFVVMRWVCADAADAEVLRQEAKAAPDLSDARVRSDFALVDTEVCTWADETGAEHVHLDVTLRVK